MSFGIRNEDVDYIIETISDFREVEKALIFGSRAIGNYKRGSDVDIALFGVDVNFSIVAKIKDKLQEESPMPFLFDIVDFTHSSSDTLKNHIRKYGAEIFNRDQINSRSK